MNTYQRWKQGMKELTPTQQLKAKMQGHLWAAIGLVIGTVIMLSKGVWYFVILLLALIWLQAWEYMGAKQRYEGAATIEKEILEKEVLKKL